MVSRFPKKKSDETMPGFKKTIQNQKYPSMLMKKLCKLTNFFISIPVYFWFWTVFLKPRLVSINFFFFGKLRKINRYLMRLVVNLLLFKAKPYILMQFWNVHWLKYVRYVIGEFWQMVKFQHMAIFTLKNIFSR